MDIKKLINSLIYLFSMFMALGTFDPILGGLPIQSIDFLFILIVALILFFYPRKLTDNIFSFDYFLLLSIFFAFGFSQIIYGYGELLKPLFNTKFLLCITFFVVLKGYLEGKQDIIHKALLLYSLSAFIFSIYILFLNPSLYVIHKGQMLVLDENPNSTSSRFAVAGTYIIYFIIYNPLGWGKERFWLFWGLPTIFFLVIASGSRGSLLALMLGTYIIVILSGISKKIKLFLTILSIAISIVITNYLFSSADLSARWEKALEGDTAGRVDIWIAVTNIVSEYPLGVGETGYLEKILNLYGKYIDTHNLFLYILVCGGFLSLILYIIFLIRMLYNSLSVYMLNRDILPFLIFILMVFISSKTGGAITYLLFWFLLSIVASYRIK